MPNPRENSDGLPLDSGSISDTQTLALFLSQPQRAWKIFIEKYADFIFSLLRRMGFDYDQAMDRFVYVCEKLSEQNFRRLKSIRYAGSHGDLTPWLRQVIKRLCVNWAWSEAGRKRLLNGIAGLAKREQRVFELYFWQGLRPSEILEHMRLEHQSLELGDVYDALEEISSHISQKKLWRLISGLSRARRTLSLDEVDEESGLSPDVPDENPNPEEALIQSADADRVAQVFETLPARERLALQFRYEELLPDADIAAMLRIEQHAVANLLKSARRKLREGLKTGVTL